MKHKTLSDDIIADLIILPMQASCDLCHTNSNISATLNTEDGLQRKEASDKNSLKNQVNSVD